jgi:signal transduction histidine kinase
MATLAVVAGRLALDPVVGRQSNRHLFFLPLAMIVAWFWGFGPAVLSAVLSGIAMSYFWLQPGHRLLHTALDLGLFLLLAVVIAALTQSLHRARARADAAAKAREQVLAIVAHDLRNPLTTIEITLAALKKSLPSWPQAANGLGTIERCAHRMETLIRDLLDATRLEQGNVTLVLRAEPVDGIVSETADAFAGQAKEKGLLLEAASPGPVAVRCDRDRVLQVLGNLMANAVRFTPEGGHVWLRADEREGQVRFEVQDTGPGVRAEDLPRLFDRYWHADERGTGLGLFIAQSLVNAQGGRIEVDSRPGLGARFFFSLPRV